MGWVGHLTWVTAVNNAADWLQKLELRSVEAIQNPRSVAFLLFVLLGCITTCLSTYIEPKVLAMHF